MDRLRYKSKELEKLESAVMWILPRGLETTLEKISETNYSSGILLDIVEREK